MTEEQFKGTSDLNIFFRSWRPPGKPRGVVVIVPGFNSHSGYYNATRPSGSLFFYDTAGSIDKTLKLYEGHFHDLLNDLDKKVVMADIQGWIDARLSPAGHDANRPSS